MLLALAIAPGLAICLYIFYRDTHDREPALNLFMSFFWGVLTVIPALILELSTQGLADKSIFGIIVSAFILVALAEEFSKYLALRYYAFSRQSFDEPLDGIIYGVMVSMGFATIENLMYALSYGMPTALLRMFTAVPAHATFGIIMGYYIGKAKFDFVKRKRLLFSSVAAPTVAHGFYDAFLFMRENTWIHRYVSPDAADLFLFAGALASLIVALVFSRRLIRLHRLTSRQLFRTAPVLTIRKATAADVELIRMLALQIWPKTYEKILSQKQVRYMMEMMYSEAALRDQIETGHQFIILYNAGLPIGFASYSETAPAVYKLHKIYVLHKQQGRGCGRFVIGHIITDITNKGAVSLQLNVNRENTAKNFYEKLGFEVIRSEDIDIGSGYFMNDYVMEKKIGAVLSTNVNGNGMFHQDQPH